MGLAIALPQGPHENAPKPRARNVVGGTTVENGPLPQICLEKFQLVSSRDEANSLAVHNASIFPTMISIDLEMGQSLPLSYSRCPANFYNQQRVKPLSPPFPQTTIMSSADRENGVATPRISLIPRLMLPRLMHRSSLDVCHPPQTPMISANGPRLQARQTGGYSFFDANFNSYASISILDDVVSTGLS